MDKGDKGLVIPFETSADLEKKRNMRVDLQKCSQALAIAYNGAGKLGIPDETEKINLENSIDLLREVERNLMHNPLTPDDLAYVARITTAAKVTVSPYLSEEQLTSIFGTDNLA